METTMTEAAPPEKKSRVPWLRLGGLLLVVVGLVFLGRTFGDLLPRAAEAVEAAGIWAPAIFIALYAVAAVAFVPGSVLTLAAGALFGIPRGTAIVLVGATAGASLAFLVSRYLARAAVEAKVQGNARFAAIDRAIGREGRKIVFLLRLSPVFPFNLLNYALGLTRVRFVDYLVASVGMLPGTLLYVYYGRLAGDVALLAAGGGAQAERGAGYWVVMGVGLLATILVTTVVTRTARRALSEATGEGEGNDV